MSLSSRRLWATWQESHQRRLAASESQVAAFAQAGLRRVVGIDTLIVVSVSGGSAAWLVLFEIPAWWMSLDEVNSLAGSVQQTIGELQDSSSPTFSTFVQGAEAVGESLSLQSCEVISVPSVVGAPKDMRADSLSGSSGMADGFILMSSLASVALSNAIQVITSS